ncbi:hypothetical protein BDZ91DRAFT_766809 [Kalaharituber pfeilii]|nr:hypothetical protein BDZ91DRAFT_766809 [Kalaharituber pfeilii]
MSIALGRTQVSTKATSMLTQQPMSSDKRLKTSHDSSHDSVTFEFVEDSNSLKRKRNAVNDVVIQISKRQKPRNTVHFAAEVNIRYICWRDLLLEPIQDTQNTPLGTETAEKAEEEQEDLNAEWIQLETKINTLCNTGTCRWEHPVLQHQLPVQWRLGADGQVVWHMHVWNVRQYWEVFRRRLCRIRILKVGSALAPVEECGCEQCLQGEVYEGEEFMEAGEVE